MSFFDALLVEAERGLAPIVVASYDRGVFGTLLGLIGADVSEQYGRLLTEFGSIAEAIRAVRAAASEPPQTLASVRVLLDSLRRAFSAVRALQLGLENAPVQDLGRDLLDVLLLRRLRVRMPALYCLAEAVGLIGLRPVGPVFRGASLIRRPIGLPCVSAERLRAFVGDPTSVIASELPSHLQTRHDADQMSDMAARSVGAVLNALGVPWSYGVFPDDADLFGERADEASHILVVEMPSDVTGVGSAGVCISLSAAADGDLGVVVSPFGNLDVRREFRNWSIEASLTPDVAGFAFGGGSGFQRLATGASADVVARLVASSRDGHPRVFGAAKGTRLECLGVIAYAEGALDHDGGSFEAGVRAQRVEFVLSADGGDGFLLRALGERELRSSAELGVLYSSGRGLHLAGSATLESTLATAVCIGPVRMTEVGLVLNATQDALSASMTFGVQVILGPVTVSVKGVGTRLVAMLPSTVPLREFDLDFAFQAPAGASLVIDAGAVRGGGYLFHDEAADRYEGVLALGVLGARMTAHGVLDARGSDYSLAAVVSAQFAPMVLPLGFRLEGVGGLIGVNRRVDVEAMRVALRGDGMADVFFPDTALTQIARLTADLRRYFPAAAGRHVVGPAVKFSWGAPPLVRGELALLLEMPAPLRIVLLGSMVASLPTQEHAIVRLAVDVVGEVDFGQRRAGVDASLRGDSHVAGFPITGAMALRLAWGEQPSLVFSVGGFHSRFRPPPGFPELRRVRIAIGSGDDPRLDVEGFLAVTSNTAQVGAQIELYASAGPLNITGALGFETLLIFSPFSLEVDVWAGMTLRRNSTVLAGVHFEGHLSGPKPWRIDGEACLSLWFIDLCVSVHKTFGEGATETLAAQEIWALLRPAVESPASWTGEMPAGSMAIASAPAPEAPRVARIDPGAMLTLRQRIVPLDRTITRFAHGVPAGANRFGEMTLIAGTGDNIGAHPVQGWSTPPVTDWFAPAEFEDMSEADKLSRPGFERMVSGVRAGPDAVRAGDELTCDVEYDTSVYIGGVAQVDPPSQLSTKLLLQNLEMATNARPPSRGGRADAYAPQPGNTPLFTLAEESYAIASTDALTLAGLGAFGSRSEVEAALRDHLAAHPEDASRLQIVAAFEAAA